MEYGSIIKRAWKITWTYRYLWILGLFAGITGMGGSGGGSGSGNTPGSSSSNGGVGDIPNPDEIVRAMQSWIPLIAAMIGLLLVIGVLFFILGIAARGGLVKSVDEIEEGRTSSAGAGWSAGFSRWGGMFLMELLLGLPGLILALVAVFVIVLPLVGPLIAGDTPGPEAIAGICGGVILLLVVGLPLSFLIGILRVLGQRYLILDGLSAVDSISASWRGFRARFKDVSIMWLINWGLNIAAGFVVAIPAVIIGVVFGVGIALSAIAAADKGNFGPLFAGIGVLIAVLMLLGFAYSAIWGTYTSSLWTIFFRRMSGREVLAPPLVAPAAPVMAGGAGYQPAPPVYAPEPAPPAPPAPGA